MINGTEVISAEEDGDMLGFNFMQHQEITSLPDTSVLIDTGATVSVFKNREVLRNITKSTSALWAHTNGGFQDSTLQGYLPGFFKVWYNPRCMVNILAWSDVRKKFRITADTNEEPAIQVHLGNGERETFRELKNSLYLGDIKEIQQKLKITTIL